MNELRNSLKMLKKNLPHLFPENVNFLPLQGVKQVAEDLENETMRRDMVACQASSVKLILQKIKSGEKLTKRERRDMPFVMADPDCDEVSLYFISIFYLEKPRERLLKRLILVYFMNYMHLRKEQKQAFQELIIKCMKSQNINPSNKFMSKMKHFANIIFAMNCTQNISRMIDKWGLNVCTNSLDLPEPLKLSELIVESTTTFFSDTNFSLENKMRTLQEVSEHSEPFYAVFPQIADSLIQSIHTSTDNKKYQYRDYCIDEFYNELNDPRYTKYAVRWNEVSDESRKIFLSWLAEKDLNLFFKIIEKTSVDSMWSYRRDFWKEYLPYITNTWVFFGKDAMRHAKQISHSRMAYGKLGKQCLPNHSVFAFQIGEYVFVEWSHNGSLRVWEANDAPQVFGVKNIDRSDITDSFPPPEEEWRHAGKTTGNWQNKVCNWIDAYCDVNPFD